MEQPQKTDRGHVNVEAFCLMNYVCTTPACGHRELIWNSRSGVTPFCVGCPSCGEPSLQHKWFGSDRYSPEHKPHRHQRFFRDGTPDEAEAIMRKRIEQMQSTEYALTDERAEALISEARNGNSEFQKGWPTIDIHVPL